MLRIEKDLDKIVEQEKMLDDLAKRHRIASIASKKHNKLNREHEAAAKVQALFRGKKVPEHQVYAWCCYVRGRDGEDIS